MWLASTSATPTFFLTKPEVFARSRSAMISAYLAPRNHLPHPSKTWDGLVCAVFCHAFGTWVQGTIRTGAVLAELRHNAPQHRLLHPRIPAQTAGWNPSCRKLSCKLPSVRTSKGTTLLCLRNWLSLCPRNFLNGGDTNEASEPL